MERLLKKDGDVLKPASHSSDPPGWVQEAYQAYKAMVMDPDDPFPCYFAVIAEEKGSIRYSYISEDELAAPLAFRDTMLEFLHTHKGLPYRPALVVFVGEKARIGALEDYERTFWGLLQYLHDNDPEPWPENMPTDPHDLLWEFCFAGVPWFFTGHAPMYVARRSRWTASGLMLIIQTRDNLTGIVGKGRAADRVRDIIRGVVKTYDSIPVSPDLGTYGDPNMREWRMYWLQDTNNPRDAACPLRITRKEQPVENSAPLP
ncbi:MAG: YqcI/YcgG family protein [Chloroflexi bacterium]|nr:YqcI/YcgG family protein [Chloroflexota bacterium]